MIRELTASASSAIQYYVDKAAANEANLAEAQEQAALAISSLRYGEEGKDYFWITDMHPRMVMHPYRSDLTGTDLTSYQESENRSDSNPFVEFVLRRKASQTWSIIRLRTGKHRPASGWSSQGIRSLGRYWRLQPSDYRLVELEDKRIHRR